MAKIEHRVLLLMKAQEVQVLELTLWAHGVNSSKYLSPLLR